MSAKKTARSLREFASDQRKATCPVCALPAEVRRQINTRNVRAIKVGSVLAWLKAEHGATITLAQYSAHTNGRHEGARAPR